MIESVSCNELYEKFHELYVMIIRHIISRISLTNADGTAVDPERLHRVQECCLAAFDELNYVMYRRALNKLPAGQSPLAVLTYTLSSVDSDELIPVIQGKYGAELTEDERNMLGGLCNTVDEQLYGMLSLSYKFLVSTGDIDLEN